MQVNIWVPAGSRLERELTSRDRDGSPASVARRDLERYYALLDREQERLMGHHVTIGAAEWDLLRDALNGILVDGHSWQLVHQDVAEAIRFDRLDEKWAVDGPALVNKLRRLCPGQLLAVVDDVERWWLRQQL